MIPKTFELLGSTWRVKKVKDLRHDGKKCLGVCHSDKRVIEIDALVFKDPDELQHTWEHEINHAIWETAGMEDVSADEEKVDLVAGLRHQLNKTSKGCLK